MSVDVNEVQGYITSCQDAGALEGFAKLCQERVQLMQAKRDGKGNLVKADGNGYINQSIHTAGGPSQPPMTGPCATLPQNTTIAEQAVINDRILQAQAKEGRMDEKNNPAAVNLGGEGEAETANSKRAKEGEDPRAVASPGGVHKAMPDDDEDEDEEDDEDEKPVKAQDRKPANARAKK